MSGNFTSNESDDMLEELDIFADYDYHFVSSINMFHQYALLVIILVGLLLNILALALQIRCRLWRQHEGHVYLAGTFVISIITLVFVLLPHFAFLCNTKSSHIEDASVVTCRTWLFTIRECGFISRWLLVAVLFNVYWRQRLDSPRSCSGCGCHQVVAKCCTLFGVKIVTLAIVVASLCINLWLIFHPQYITYNTEHQRCVYNHSWFFKNWVILVVWRFLNQEVPLLLFTPVLWVLVVCGRRKANGFSFTTLDSSHADEWTREFTSASLVIAAVVFCCKAPHSVWDLLEVEALGSIEYRTHLAISVSFYILFEICSAVVPVVYVVMLGSTRQFIKAEILQKRCCPPVLVTTVRGAEDSIALQESFDPNQG